jgi:UDP-glucose:(heptosyl)LPS alpha-1,3-glucosyltransferase
MASEQIAREKMERESAQAKNRSTSWPLNLHRRIYYRLLEFLENKVYRRDDIVLAAVSEKGAQDIRARFGPKKHLSVIYHGVDCSKFNPQQRMNLRAAARADLVLALDAFVVLFIGNDWRNRGLPCLLEAVGKLQDPKVHLLVVGTDASAAYQQRADQLGLAARIHFLPPRLDVELYYAAADAYAGPSLEDTFSLPPAEAMACGLPVITSRAAGVSEIIHHNEDGLILEDSVDAKTLAQWLARLKNDRNWRDQLGLAAAQTAAQYTWSDNSAQLQQVINSLIKSKIGT